MSTRVEKYIIALQTQYEDSEQVKKLQQDISTLGQVEKLQKFNADLKRVADLSVEYNSLPHVRGSVPLHISHLRRVFIVEMTPVF